MAPCTAPNRREAAFVLARRRDRELRLGRHAADGLYEKLTSSRVSVRSRRKLLLQLISASQPQDHPQVLGKPHPHRGIDFEVTEPFVVVGTTLVNQSKINKPLQTPAHGRRRTKFQQEQPLDRQRAPLFLVVADFDNERIINRGLKAGEMFLRKCLKSSKLLKHISY